MNIYDKLLVAFGTIGIFCSILLIGALAIIEVIARSLGGKISADLTTLFIGIVGANLFAAAIMFGARNSGRGF
jgi:flagellar motor component MotA